jgi:hypothetical protein
MLFNPAALAVVEIPPLVTVFVPIALPLPSKEHLLLLLLNASNPLQLLQLITALSSCGLTLSFVDTVSDIVAP